MYVDNLTSGGNPVEQVVIFKQKCEGVFRKGGFNLQKWYSNVPSLQTTKTTTWNELIYSNESKWI